MSISQSWVRPIVREKANVPVEFGAEVTISMVDGFAAIERLSWDVYNEGTTLQEKMEASETSIHLTFIVMNLEKDYASFYYQF